MLDDIQRKALVSIGAAAEELKLSVPTVTVALDRLARLGAAKRLPEGVELGFSDTLVYLKILSEGTEPIQQ